MSPFGFRPWEKNPTLCKACVNYMNRYPGGAEILCTLLFADVRGSTSLAERSSSADFAALLRRFYAVGSQALIDQGGIVDKYVGDEVVGLFIPGIAGTDHALAAIRAADQLLQATGHGTTSGPWLNIGIGVHSGQAFVGTVAVGSEVSDFTALGDTVNVASRIAAEAGAGELLISEDAARTAGVRLDSLDSRELAVRGREAHLTVRVAQAGSLPPDATG
jgi:adenylate cyclase